VINQVEEEKVEENVTEVNATSTEDLLLEKWQMLCDKGLEKFCRILEQKGG
jgi:hypothetical protein